MPVQDHDDVDEPRLVAAVDEQQQEHSGAEHEIGADDERTFLDAVDEHAGRGRERPTAR